MHWDNFHVWEALIHEKLQSRTFLFNLFLQFQSFLFWFFFSFSFSLFNNFEFLSPSGFHSFTFSQPFLLFLKCFLPMIFLGFFAKCIFKAVIYLLQHGQIQLFQNVSGCFLHISWFLSTPYMKCYCQLQCFSYCSISFEMAAWHGSGHEQETSDFLLHASSNTFFVSIKRSCQRTDSLASSVFSFLSILLSLHPFTCAHSG